MLLFLLIMKNYCIQDVTYSEVDSWCKIDSFSNLQMGGGGGGGGKHEVVGEHMARSHERSAEHN